MAGLWSSWNGKLPNQTQGDGTGECMAWGPQGQAEQRDGRVRQAGRWELLEGVYVGQRGLG